MARSSPAGPGEVLRLIRDGTVVTRRDIAEVTGLSRVTVTQRVDALRVAGLITEYASDQATGGRRPTGLRVDTGHGLVLCAVVDTRHAELTCADLAGEVLAQKHLEVSVADGPEPVLSTLVTELQRLVRATRRPMADVDGVGIALPGPVDPTTGRPSWPPLMPGWDAYDVEARVRRTWDVAVVVENDANATALGEQSWHHPDASVLCLVKVSTGIGSGIVVDGKVLAGVDGSAGDIGHVRLDGHQHAVCTCGQRGCLASVAGGGAVAAQLDRAGTPAGSGSDVGALLDAGDVLTEQLVREAGRLIGRVASMVVSVVNPQILVVTGDLASPALLSGVQEAIHEFSLPRATRNLRVTLGGLGDDAARVGLTRMVVDRVLAPEAVDVAVGWV